MDAEQNWRNLCTNHVRDWRGIWTRYSPQGDVTESFQSLRRFRTNLEQTEIAHTNFYMYPDGRKVEESWEYNITENSLADGLFHPQTHFMRAIFFDTGHAAWVTTKLKTGFKFGVELFFRHAELRHSVGIVYDEQGNLSRTANIREDITVPSKFWSTEVNQLPERNFSGNWQGTAISISPDLKISTPVDTKLKSWKGHETFFLPDGVTVSCPPKVSVDTPFSLVANWMISASEMHQLIADYTDSAFTLLTLQLFHQSD
jgi:hypothetical protein